MPTSMFGAMLYLVSLLSVLASAVEGIPKHDGRCGALDGTCTAPTTAGRIARDDAGLGLAVDLMQLGLTRRRQDSQAADTALNTSDAGMIGEHAILLASELNRSASAAFKTAVAPCILAPGDMNDVPPPLEPTFHADTLALQELGFVDMPPLAECESRGTLSLISWMPHKTIKERNQLAKWIMIIWVVMVGGAIMWSIITLLMVPSKPATRQVHNAKLNLADEDTAWKKGFLQWASLSWADDLMGRYGKCLHSVIDDAELVEDRMDEDYMPYIVFRKYWMEQVEAVGVEKASFFFPLYKVVGLKALVGLVVAIFLELFLSNVGMIIALDKFLTHLQHMGAAKQANPELEQSYLESTIMIIIYIFGVPMCFRTATIVVHLLDGYYTNVCAAGLAAVVFEKALSLPVGISPPKPGEEDVPGYYEQNMRPNVVQILNVDIIECWGYLLKTMVYMVVSPLVSIVLFVLLIRKIQLAGLLGVMYMLPCTLGSMRIMGFSIRYWIQYQGFQDERLRWLTETMIHIRTIKSLAWEKLSFQKLQQARERELRCNQLCALIQGVCGAIGHTTPWGTMLTAAMISLVTEGYLEAATILVIQRLMGSMLHVTSMMLNGGHKFVQVPNSFKRIRKFLAEADLPMDVVHPLEDTAPDAPAVVIKGSFSYVKEAPAVLHNLNISVKQGELLAVVGAVASGKSALLQTIIGELYTKEGAFVQGPMPGQGHLVYCAQVPWIFEGTLRDNVLLNQGLEPERYYKALYAASLMQDLEILPGGDQVTIGSYGIRLSGGQRARVALARAAYHLSAEVVVIDDPFASVDMPTGQHICEELLLGPLMKRRTRIVTMQPNPAKLRCADKVLVLDAGRVTAYGTPEEVIASKTFAALMSENSGEPAAIANDAVQAYVGDATRGGQQTARVCERKAAETGYSLRDEEAQEHVTWSTMFWWLWAAGYHNLGFYFAMMVVARWVGLWEALAVAGWVNTKLWKEVDDLACMLHVIRVVLLNCLVVFVSAYAASRVSISASTQLHSTVIQSILRAPIDKFFDKQPVGRLINRLSFDMRKVDDSILGVITALLGFVTGFIVTESFILKVVPGHIAFASIPVFLASFFYIYIFRGAAVPLVFHSKFSLSSVQDLQATVLTSCVSVRANNMFDGFMERFNHYSHSVIRCQYLIFHVCACWVQCRVFLCFSALTCIFAVGGLWANMPLGTLAAVIAQQYGQMSEFEGLSGGFTAFINILNALERLMRLTDCVKEAPEHQPGDIQVRRSVQMAGSDLVPLEVKRTGDGEHVTICLKGGAPLLESSADGTTLNLVEGRRLRDLAPRCSALQDIDDDYQIVGVNGTGNHAGQMADELAGRPQEAWIDLWHRRFSGGMRVQIESLTAGYNNEKNVLHGISIDIPAATKMGIAGKTGCGKSTTMLCLLRMLEPRSGRVLLGGMDSSTMGLLTLRQIVGLVPQDPTIFEGSIRHNIDPFGQYPDSRIWDALKSMQLLELVSSQSHGLNFSIAKEGGNMSFGQRQLLSLARMVIRQPPVLLLDECTSALDPHTQEVVQKAILTEFPLTTVIAIAHRVETIVEFDRVTLLHDGHVAEQGPVSEVLQIPKGAFASMVKLASQN